MALEDLQVAPPVGYHELARSFKSSEESLTFAAKKSERQGIFIAQLADYISGKPVITSEIREFILHTFNKHFEYELTLAKERHERLRNERI